MNRPPEYHQSHTGLGTMPPVSPITRAVAEFRHNASQLLPTEEETEWLAAVNRFNPDGHRTGELIAWSRALRSYGTPLSFVRDIKIEEGTLTIYDKEIPTSWVVNKGHALRRELITAQQPYEYKRSPTEYPVPLHLGEEGCKLCENIAQGIDANDDPSIPSNVVIDLGESFVMPNRYPATPLHSLWIPKSHDDNSTRATTLEPSSSTFRLPHSPGLTRGNILTAKQLAELFELSDQLEMIAARNHIMDGMSIPGHDHFHLLLKEQCEDGHLEKLLEPIKNIDCPCIVELDSVPYALLAVKGGNPHDTAQLVAPILQTMEELGYVFVISYVEGVAIISPREPTSLNENIRLSLGAGSSIAGFNIKTDVDNARTYLPRRGEFDWQPILNPDPFNIQEKNLSVSNTYRPIPLFNGAPEWRTGEMVSQYLNDRERAVWNQCAQFQDKRNDFGHAEVVTYLTFQNAKVQGLSRADTEVAVLAAILHDTGWSQIENIGEIFSKNSTIDVNDRNLRKLHQQHSVAIAKKILRDYPHLDRVIAIIENHDTRESPDPVDTVTACMWDADILWRVTAHGVRGAQNQSGIGLQEAIDSRQKWLSLGRESLHLESSLEIGQIEFNRINRNL